MYNENILFGGIEGARKSVTGNKLAIKIATRYKPVLFAYRDYELLRENRQKLINDYGVDEKEICVCGTSKKNPEALKSYTNPEKPRYMTPMAKYIMCSQAVLQRNKHLNFVSAGNHKKGFGAIIVDEFDFRLITIPTKNYFMSHISDEQVRSNIVEEFYRWVMFNYDSVDYEKFKISDETNDRYKNFYLANWFKSAKCPVMFLSSEILVARFLKLIGFKYIYLESPDYKHCIVNTHSSRYLVSEFYDVMNEHDYWEDLRKHYDIIVSDKAQNEIKLESDEETTKLVKKQKENIVNHTVVRGSNKWIGKNILTILSHVPFQVLSEIRDIFHEFGDKISDEEVYQLFYRDRACQALGRVLGNRGGVTTDLLANERIVKSIMTCDSFPYTLKPDWEIPLENIDEIWEQTLAKRDENKLRRKKYEEEKLREKVEKTYNELDKHFVKRKNSMIPTKDLSNYLLSNNIKSKYGEKNLPVKHVAEHFDVQMKKIMINKKRQMYVVGLDYANRVNINPETREITEA